MGARCRSRIMTIGARGGCVSPGVRRPPSVSRSPSVSRGCLATQGISMPFDPRFCIQSADFSCKHSGNAHRSPPRTNNYMYGTGLCCTDYPLVYETGCSSCGLQGVPSPEMFLRGYSALNGPFKFYALPPAVNKETVTLEDGCVQVDEVDCPDPASSLQKMASFCLPAEPTTRISKLTTSTRVKKCCC